MELHDLIAAYSLDALDPDERREFERHLLACERCRAELPGLQEAAGALAFAVEAPPPPPELRQSILDEARGERQNVLPLRRRRPFQAAIATAALAAAAAVALALWGTSLSRDLDRERAAAAARADVMHVLTSAESRRVELRGGEGSLVVGPSRRAALLLDRLAPAPPGKTYEAWVIHAGKTLPAGLFDARDGRAEVLLDEPVPAGATVAVTVEDDAGARQPTSAPLLSAIV
jgi:anti-sigma factor RsiW